MSHHLGRMMTQRVESTRNEIPICARWKERGRREKQQEQQSRSDNIESKRQSTLWTRTKHKTNKKQNEWWWWCRWLDPPPVASMTLRLPNPHWSSWSFPLLHCLFLLVTIIILSLPIQNDTSSSEWLRGDGEDQCNRTESHPFLPSFHPSLHVSCTSSSWFVFRLLPPPCPHSSFSFSSSLIAYPHRRRHRVVTAWRRRRPAQSLQETQCCRSRMRKKEEEEGEEEEEENKERSQDRRRSKRRRRSAQSHQESQCCMGKWRKSKNNHAIKKTKKIMMNKRTVRKKKENGHTDNPIVRDSEQKHTTKQQDSIKQKRMGWDKARDRNQAEKAIDRKELKRESTKTNAFFKSSHNTTKRSIQLNETDPMCWPLKRVGRLRVT